MENIEQGQQRDNFWMYVGGIVILAIALVVIFKSTHKEAIPSAAYAETAKQVEQQLEAAKRK
ncbi:MAG: hypothetical protein H6R26_2522 [Proteobacteria bacterium]|nr:hypothetical protein [Pseudomonadota bacterium]